jgi:lantibiotic modifying enzyme
MNASLRDRARAMASRLGERLLVESRADEFETRGLVGAPGRALAFMALARSAGDPRYREASVIEMLRAARSDDVPTIGLFVGISGLRAVAALSGAEEPAYQRLVEQCDAYVEAALPATGRFAVDGIYDYDVIGGWSGARLARCVTGPRSVDRLTTLLAWLIARDERWCCVHPIRVEDPPENDLGVSHGIAGVLAAIALTTTDIDESLRESLAEQAWRVASRVVRRGARMDWPDTLQAAEGSFTRSAWCYGAAGIAAALYWVSRRTSDGRLERFAIEALEAHAALDPSDWEISDHAVCHGTLGVALVFASTGFATGSAKLLEAASDAIAYALDGLERDNAACFAFGPDGARSDLSEELTGAVGIILALLTFTGDADARWLRLHALEPLPAALLC